MPAPQLDTVDVILTDKRTKVKMRELSGMQMMAASKMATGKSGDADGITLAAVCLCMSIVEFDGQPHKRPSSIVEVQTFMAGIRGRDFSKLSQAYGSINGEGEPDASGEDQAADGSTST